MDNQIRIIFYTLLILYFVIIIMYGLVKQQNELLNKLKIQQGKTKLVFEHKYLPLVLRSVFRINTDNELLRGESEYYQKLKHQMIRERIQHFTNEVISNACEITDYEIFNSRQREIEVKLYLYKKENV